MPTDAADLLDLMDDASSFARRGQGAGAPAYDHGVRAFHQLNAHYQSQITRELGGAHHALKTATDALKSATWWRAGVTFVLGLLELYKLAMHH